MKNYCYVFIGGAAGGLMRAMAVRAEDLFFIGDLDTTILLVNIAGAFLLGLFLAGTSRIQVMSPGIHLGVAVGFFGSFTTFSTLTMEAVGLMQTGNGLQMIYYVLFSCTAGLLAAGLGLWAGTEKQQVYLNGFRTKVYGKLSGKISQQATIPAPIDGTEEE